MTTAVSEESVMKVVSDIHNRFAELRLRRVTFVDYEPPSGRGPRPIFAKQFLCEEGTEDVVRAALDRLEDMRVVEIERKPMDEVSEDSNARRRVRITVEPW